MNWKQTSCCDSKFLLPRSAKQDSETLILLIVLLALICKLFLKLENQTDIIRLIEGKGKGLEPC